MDYSIKSKMVITLDLNTAIKLIKELDKVSNEINSTFSGLDLDELNNLYTILYEFTEL